MSIKALPSKVRRTKSEIQSDFEQIREKLTEQKQERTLKDEESARLREKETREATQNITAESIVQKIGALELDISKALSGLSAQFLSEAKQLQWLREGVALEQEELGRLHKIDIAKTALDQVIEECSERKILLDKEIEETRAQWIAESERREKEIKLSDEELTRRREREKEEYEYELAQERKLAQDKYDASLRDQERNNKEKQEILEKTWAVREAALKEREDELSRLRRESVEFPERLKKEIDLTVAQATQALEAQHKQAYVLAQKDAETNGRLAEQRIQSLEETVLRQSEEIKSLTLRVEESKNQVQEIAIKAIESASGASALSHVNKIAIEQAKTRSPQP